MGQSHGSAFDGVVDKSAELAFDGSAAQTSRHFKRKVVRDLSWLILSPAVLSEDAGMELLGSSAGRESLNSTLTWLRDLDVDPSHLLETLQTEGHSSLKRLGFYAAALTQYWLEHGPGWNTKKVLSSVQLSSAAGSKQTAGQLKLVCLRPEEALHVESSIKYFADASSVAESTSAYCTSCYVGPFLHENLAWRLAEAQRKVTSTGSEHVQAYLRKQFGDVPVRSVYLLKGFIFKPLDEYFKFGRALRSPPPELNSECATGWYTTDVNTAVSYLSPSARLVVLPKLFWLGPAVAVGNPPCIVGEGLPGQRESVPVDLPEKVKQDVIEHMSRAETALLVCELVKLEGCSEEIWVERSRGFVLPETWDPKALITGGPNGMKSSEKGPKWSNSCEEPTKWSNQRRKYSERLADTARQPAPSLAGAGVQSMPQLNEELTVGHLVQYVMTSKESRRSSDPARYEMKLALRASLAESEVAETGAACRFICAALQEVTTQGFRVEGHFLLDLLAKPVRKQAFDGDAPALTFMFETALRDAICMRLAVKVAACFSWTPPPLADERVLNLYNDVLKSNDRARLLGLLEFLSASSSLKLDASGVPLELILERLTSPPADASLLEIVCQAKPELCSGIAARLTESGQLKLARRIEERRWRNTKHESTCEASAAVSGKALGAASLAPDVPTCELPLLSMPERVRVVQVEDFATMKEVCARVAEGGVVGVDAEWRPFPCRIGDNVCDDDTPSTKHTSQSSKKDRLCQPVQLLQLAWAEVVYLLDIPALHRDDETRRLLRQALEELFTSPTSRAQSEKACYLVGYGLEGDIRRMAESYPVLMAAAASDSWLGIEIQELIPSKQKAGGLDHLCALELGSRLDKAMQLSDWEARPLSAAQVKYAALDAWILLVLLGCMAARHASEDILQREAQTTDAAAPRSQEDRLSCLANVSVPVATSLGRLFASPCEVGACAVAGILQRLNVASINSMLVPSSISSSLQDVDVLVCKTLACMAVGASGIDPSPCLVVLPVFPNSDLCFSLLASALKSASARLATAEELRECFQQPRGTVGPVGPALMALPKAVVVVDESLLSTDNNLSCGAGTPGWQLIVPAKQLLELTGGIGAPVRRVE